MRIGTGLGTIWLQRSASRLHKVWGIPWIDEELLVSQEGVCFMQLVSSLVSWLVDCFNTWQRPHEVIIWMVTTTKEMCSFSYEPAHEALPITFSKPRLDYSSQIAGSCNNLIIFASFLDTLKTSEVFFVHISMHHKSMYLEDQRDAVLNSLYLYAFFWVITRRLDFICRRFGTLCLFHLHRQVDVSRIN